MSNIPSRLKHARESAGFTQEELAQKIGSGRVSISRWETGQAEPSRHVLASIGYATGRTPDWLLTGEGPEKLGGVAEQANPYRADALDAELLAAILATIQEAFAAKGKRLPPAVFAALCVEAYQEALRNPDLRGEALVQRLQPFIRLALAGAG